jgi:dolichyl-phosphate-mannose-protein mannosyltransferase
MPDRSGPRRIPPELFALTALAALTRFIGLFYPNAVVFDELYSERYAARYLTGSFYFDVHPPLGRLMIAGAAKVLGVATTTLTCEEPAVVLRVLPALFGTLLVPLVYVLLRQLRANRSVATLGAALVLLDNALLVQSRFVLTDIFLIVFGLVAISLFLAARVRSGVGRGLLLSVSAIAAGAAVSVKWTGLSALGLIGLVWLVDEIRQRKWQQRWRRIAIDAAILVVLPIATYAATFAIHFALLTKSGPGETYMSLPYQATLAGNVHYRPDARVSFLSEFVELNEKMSYGNALIGLTTHAAASPWYTWPILKHRVPYWSKVRPAPDGRVEHIDLLGNLALWWGVVFAVLGIAVMCAARRPLFAGMGPPLAFLAVAYAANYLPFIPIHRSMYLYHYLFAFVFSVALGALGLGVLLRWNEDEGLWVFPTRLSRVSYWLVVVAVAGMFLFLAPISYGWPISRRALEARLWVIEGP